MESVWMQHPEMISENTFDVGSCVQEMQVLNQSYIQSAMQAVCQDAYEGLQGIQKGFRKRRRMIAKLVRTPKEMFAYECGIFNGVYKVMEEIGRIHLEEEERHSSLRVLERKHVRDILTYLCMNPDAKQGNIANETGISPNHLSEILNLLVREGYVVRYGKNKSTRYCVTGIGRRSVAFPVQMKEPDVYMDVDFKEIQSKEAFFRGRICDNKQDGLKKEAGYAEWKRDFRADREVVFYR